MNKIFRIIAAAAFVTGTFAACTDLSDFEDRIDSLESRVTALETQIVGLNANIEALQKLTAGGTVNSATVKDGVWTIVLSNGETLTLTQGSIGVGNAPVMSVDKDGYWMVDYGTGATHILLNGEKVKAIGTDGKTPVFGVDANGYWTVSYDDGKTFTQVQGADGKPVSALPQGEVQDPYFDGVELVDGNLEITLRGGQKLTVPVITDFLCAIETTGLQMFDPGQAKPFNVTLKGVKSTMITTPAGWKASLSEAVDNKAVLTVTAPVTTKSTIADSGSDVTILAFSEQNYAAISKIQVQLSDAPVVINPIANVSAGEATETSLTYNVATADASSWKYIHQKESEAAPDAAKIVAEGTEGTGTSVSFEGLESGTAYVLYVLPINGSVQGSVASAKNTTVEAVVVINDLYQAYLDGQEIVIAGKTFSKAVNGDPVLKVASAKSDATIKNTFHQKEAAVVFIEADADKSFALTSVSELKGNIAIVSRYVDKPVTIECTSYIKLMSGSLAFDNVVIDFNGTTQGYFMNNANATADFGGVYFNNVKMLNIIKPVLYSSVATYGYNEFIVENSTFHIAAGAQAKFQLFNFYKSSVLHTYKKITFDNNIVYCDDLAHQVQLFNYDQNVAQAGSPWEVEVSICNNTIYNSPSANGYFKFFQVKALKMNKNIFWADPSINVTSYCMIIYSEAQDQTVFDTTDNIAYGNAGTWTIAHSNSKYIPTVNKIDKLAASPFATADVATGVFTTTAEYASYGAQR
jgi:hypothetical protein